MKFSIVIPVFNESKNLPILIKQIFKNLRSKTFELIIVDDNSTDGTRKEILKIKKKSKSVNYIFRPKKLGIGSAHKDGLKYAYKKKYTKPTSSL